MFSGRTLGAADGTVPKTNRCYDMRLCDWARSEKVTRRGPAAEVAVDEYGGGSCCGPEHEVPPMNETPLPRAILNR